MIYKKKVQNLTDRERWLLVWHVIVAQDRED